MARCLAFAEEATKKRQVVSQNQTVIFCLSSAICVWYQRIGNNAKLVQWHAIAVKYETAHFSGFLSASAFLRQVECKLLEYASQRAINKSTVADKIKRSRLRKVVQRDLKYIAKTMAKWRCLRPRYLHLLAYEAALTKNSSKCKNLLQQSYDLCTDVKNVLECKSVIQSSRWFFKPDRLISKDTDSTPIVDSDDLWMQHAINGMPSWSHADEAGDAVSLRYRYPIPQRLYSSSPWNIEGSV